MTLVGFDLHEADIGRLAGQRHHQIARILRREQPVAGKGDDAEAYLRAGEGLGQIAVVVGGEIEIIHRARDVEIRIGVKAVDEGIALMTQIAFDLEIGLKPIGEGAAVLKVAAEFALQRSL